jgi:signal transduction histidine kinase
MTDAPRPPRTLQHAFNNPLTALMAEIQLLQMDPTASPSTLEAAERMLSIATRLAEMTKQLGDLPEPTQPPGA